MLVSGGGIRTWPGHRRTNSKGEIQSNRPLTPNDLWATMYKHLGIDPDTTFPDHSGRPMPILPLWGADCAFCSVVFRSAKDRAFRGAKGDNIAG